MKFWVGLLISVVAAFLLGKATAPRPSSELVQGNTVTVDTVFMRDTIRINVSEAQIKVIKKFVHDTVGAVREPPVSPADSEKPADTAVCYSFSQESKNGAYATALVCSRYFPQRKPWDLTGSMDIYCGRDTMRVPARIDTLVKYQEMKSSIRGWHYVAAGVVVGVLGGFLIAK